MERLSTFNDALYKYSSTLSTVLGFRDNMTQLHSEGVRGLSQAFGIRLGLDGEELSTLLVSSCFHDIGKIGTPDRILLKPARFDADEWEIMKQHSVIGEKIMRSLEIGGSDHAATIIRHHHEHYDGGGYPDGLAGKDIPVCARIISIADSYDALAVTRSYHRARNHEAIMEILREETGTVFDPELMDVFTDLIKDSPYRTTNA